MDLNGLIGFNVAFDFTNVPTLVLQPTTIIPNVDQPNLTGHFVVTQPDGMAIGGAFNSINWNGDGYNSYYQPLRLGNDGTYQKGSYSIVFFAQCSGFRYSQITRSWDMEYNTITQKLESAFDCFTPSLKYKDSSNYGVGGYNITSQSSSWRSNCIAGSSSSSTQILDLSIGGSYYDCLYTIGYAKIVSYQHSSYSWLSVIQKYTSSITARAQTPSTMKVLFGYLTDLETSRDAAKSNYTKFQELDAAFNEAGNLFQIIKLKVTAGSTTGLINLFNQYYNLTHSYAPFIYTNTNLIIPAYDITSSSIDPNNSSSSSSFNGIAGQDLSGGKLVYLSAGSFFLYDGNNETLADMAFGITRGAAKSGAAVIVQMGGVFTEVGLGLIAGKIYYSVSDGLLSTTPGKVITIIGIAVDTDNLKMDIQQSIITI